MTLNVRKTLERVFAAGAIAAVAYFLYRAFRLNWHSIQSYDFQFNVGFMLLSLACVVSSGFLATYTWYVSMNALSVTGKLSFGQSVAAVNASGLTKYVPGKVWSYALQMYWLAAAGFAKSLVAFVNLLNLYISLVSAVAVALFALLLARTPFPFSLILAALIVLLLADYCSMRFYSPVFGFLVRLLSRTLKRDIQFFELPPALVLRLHAAHTLAALAIGAASYFVCLGIGYQISVEEVPLVLAAALLAEVGGFLAVFVPGGLGVRESIMYVLLGGSAKGAIALVLPLASRFVGMLADVLLGALALAMLRQLRPRQLS
ncbi:MAG TPA: hypothetical protein VER33_26035 [Polyangiaceae bacterium]|nr:hypothetical protein [Polyangiaceae bacterium]